MQVRSRRWARAIVYLCGSIGAAVSLPAQESIQPAAIDGKCTFRTPKTGYNVLKLPATRSGFVDSGTAVFEDGTKAAGLAGWTHTMGSPDKGLILDTNGSGVGLIDYDNDGWLDIYLVNGSTFNALDGKETPPHAALFHNNRDGTFTDVAAKAGVTNDRWGFGVAIADYDNDGWPDLVITNLANQRYAVYQNLGDGTFDYASYSTGIAAMTLLHSGWGVHLADFDNDGLKDLLVAQGHVMDNIELNFPNLRSKEPPLIARNGGRRFEDVSARAGDPFRQLWAARGLAIGDIDNDGRIDAVITVHDGPLYVLRNVTENENHWLTLKLEGRISNRDGIGAEIKLVSQIGKTQYVTVSTAGSYLSASDRRAHFGLGKDSSAKLIEIRWPSGIVQKLENVSGDQILTVTEPAK